MAGGGGEGSRKLDQTPTWAVAAVCAVIIVISIILEKGLHRIGEWLNERRKKALFEALEKVKSELMILGFISLLLTFGQSYIAKICISEKTADTMLPCRLRDSTEEANVGHWQRHLLEDIFYSIKSNRRGLSGGETGETCAKGKVPLVSIEGIHQLHIFIFFLAIFHVLYSALTMALGRAKIRGWKEWEKETGSLDYEFSNDPSRFRFSHETSFVRQHISFWNRVPVLFYFVSFFRQFFRSVRKADYLTMRHGFINVHLAPGTKFDFQKYIKRSLEDDFKVVVGISPVLWASAVIYLLINVHGWQALLWVELVPLIIILAVGTKLQAIITKMALEINERHAVVQGIPLVQLSDRHFWFSKPQLVLFLIHFTLFQNAFQIIYFLWIWYEFGLKSCFHDNFNIIIVRVCLGVVVQFVCSYITLPLYALVSQMGSHMKKSIFDEQTSRALKKWRLAAKKRQGKSGNTPGGTPDASPSASQVHPLQRYKTIGHSGSVKSRKYLDQDVSDSECETPSLVTSTSTTILIPGDMEGGSHEAAPPLRGVVEHRNEDEFSFSKPPQV